MQSVRRPYSRSSERAPSQRKHKFEARKFDEKPRRTRPDRENERATERGSDRSSTRKFSRDAERGPKRRFSRDSERGSKGRFSRDSERNTQRDSDRAPRPKIQRGPWKESAYLPSFALAPKVRPNDAPKPVRLPRIEASEEAQVVTQGGEQRERLQKVLARCGVASRRKAELLILEGAVTINGRVASELGTRVNPKTDKIKVNGSLIYTEVEPIYLALYKPKGMISALSDPEGRRHIGHIVSSIRERVIPIGRLNYNSEGLLLLTNDGDLAEKVLKTRGIPKVYMVKVKGHPDQDHLDMLKRGIFTGDGVVRFNAYGVEQTLKNKSWLKLEVVEGSQLDLREMLNQRGLLVDRIVRTAIGPISVRGLEPGEYRFMKRQDFEKVLELAESNR